MIKYFFGTRLLFDSIIVPASLNLSMDSSKPIFSTLTDTRILTRSLSGLEYSFSNFITREVSETTILPIFMILLKVKRFSRVFWNDKHSFSRRTCYLFTFHIYIISGILIF